MAATDEQPDLPLPISYLRDGSYLLFSPSSIAYLRRVHNIGGVLTGSLPQIPQQNVFLGLPLQLMPEEAKVLVDQGIAYIVDDASRHESMNVVKEDRERYLMELRKQGSEAARLQAGRRERKREEVLRKLALKNDGNTAKRNGGPESSTDSTTTSTDGPTEIGETERNNDDTLFGSSEDSRRSSTPTPSMRSVSVDIPALAVTPAASDLLLPPTKQQQQQQQQQQQKQSTQDIQVPKSYPVFAQLHSKNYFISPGLRFGCQYMVYPGDPLRFHSHFLANGYGWDEEIDLMDIVGGGRLGTGVKKSFLIGGRPPTGDETDANSSGDDDSQTRTWSIEWAGM